MPRALLTAFSLLLLTGCHDARRESPLDPELTPATTLAVALLDSTGVVQLTWEPYAGAADLAEWWVLRNEANSSIVDTLARVQPGATPAFADSSTAPDTRYEYRVSVVNTQGLEMPSLRSVVSGYSLEPVRTVTAAADSTAALIRLNWPVYDGPGFTQYQVLRRQMGTDATDTLASLADVTTGALVDTTALHGVRYQYSIITDAAGQQLDGAQVEAVLTLPTPVLDSVTFESTTASATVRWQPYDSRHFSRYVITRAAPGEADQVIATYDSAEQQTHTDTDLRGNVSYSYGITVETDRHEAVMSRILSGTIHGLVDSWQIDIDWDGSLQATVDARGYGNQFDVGERISMRLEGAGQSSGIRLWEETPGALERRYRRHAIRQYGRNGSLQAFEALPLNLNAGGGSGSWYGAVALSDAVRYIVVYHRPTGSTTLYRSGDVGTRFFEETELLSLPLDAAPTGVVELRTEGRTSGFLRMSLLVDGVAVPLVDGEELEHYGDRSSIDPPPGWTGVVRSWGVIATPLVGDTPDQFIELLAGASTRRDYTDAEWDDVELRVTLWGDTEAEWESTLTLGDSISANLALRRNDEQVLLVYNPGDGSASRAVTFDRPATGAESFVLRISQGMAHLLEHRDTWLTDELPVDQTTLIAHGIDDGITFAIGPQPYHVSAAGELSAIGGGFDSRITEIRAREQRLGQWMGVALPDERQVRFGVVRAGSQDSWASRLTQSIGPQVNSRNRMFSYPISFDFSPDGRVYILDAAVATIYVYDLNRRQYITEFGGLGSGPGQFDFGPGTRGSDGEFNFRGSVAVDDEGYVYVADEVNRRVQVFAP